ncbi:hypothetical protein KI372_06860 [Halobacterium salinarum]|nr:hypothetical protein [Halobacterium salinarum]
MERELNQQGYQNIVVREMTDALLRTVVEKTSSTKWLNDSGKPANPLLQNRMNSVLF